MNGWTKADITRLREQMLSQGRGIDEIADEVRAVCRVTRMASYRLALGLSQPQAVARCRKHSPGGAFDQPTLSRLEQFPASGSRTPLAVQLMALATAYGTQPLRLLTPQALEQLDPRERDVVVRLAGRAAPAPVVPVSTPPVPPLPAPASSNGVRAATGTVISASRRAFQFCALAEGSNIGAETLAEFEAEVRRLAAAYPIRPAGAVLLELTQIQDLGFRLLEGRQRPPQTASLYLLTGIVSGMLAKASHDLGDSGAAMTQARAAFICADNADHHGLRTWIRGLQSLICYWAGWSSDALRYARMGAEPARHGRGSTTVWIAAQEARAWGMVGNESATVSALTQADRLRERVRPDDLDEIGGILTFPPSRQLYYAADALALIPERQADAEDRADQAIAAHEQSPPSVRSFSDEAGARCDLAVSRARRGDVEGAGEALRPVLALPVAQRINGVIASVRRVDLAAAGLAIASLATADLAVSRSGDLGGSRSGTVGGFAGVAGGPHDRAGRDLRNRIQTFCQRPAREV
jgi:transcriptional regulator with XRE-family HTH domain